MKLTQSVATSGPPLVTLTTFPAIAPPYYLASSPTDWSDVDQFVKDVDSICTSLNPVLTLGEQLQQFIRKANTQLVIPCQLRTKLNALQTETQFLYDFSNFLQLIPIFGFLPPLSAGLEGELTSIKSLDSDMSQFVHDTSSLSTSLQVIFKIPSSPHRGNT